MKNEFSLLHPVISFLYFLIILLFSMFLMNPVCIVLSLGGAFSLRLYLRGKSALRAFFIFTLPLMLAAAVVNPLFNHEGATILTYFPSGNPLTLESLIFGAAAAGMLACVMLWFSSFSDIITSDKLMYLFSRVIPSLSLVLSMILRFIPRLTQRAKEISSARDGIGIGTSSGSLRSRIRSGASVLSALVTWSLESSIDTSDSMRGRGYGLRGRSTFSIYTFSRRDAVLLCIISLLSIFVLCGIFFDVIHFSFFPVIAKIPHNLFSVIVYTAYFGLSFLPIIIEVTEDIKWRASKSKI